ncbi:unnamed protein product [Rhodiola kirilowii]
MVWVSSSDAHGVNGGLDSVEGLRGYCAGCFSALILCTPHRSRVCPHLGPHLFHHLHDRRHPVRELGDVLGESGDGVSGAAGLRHDGKSLSVKAPNLMRKCAATSMTNRWIRPEVYPLFAATGVAVGICAMQLIRNISTNPDVRVTKENRTAGVLDNHAEGERYSQHFVRKYVRGRAPEIMPALNSFFTDPERN